MARQAKLTEMGAYRLGHPELAGKTVTFDTFSFESRGVDPVMMGTTVDNVFFEGKRLGATLSYAGREPGLELLHPLDPPMGEWKLKQ